MGMKPPKNEPNNAQIGDVITKPNQSSHSANIPGCVTDAKSTEDSPIPGTVIGGKK